MNSLQNLAIFFALALSFVLSSCSPDHVAPGGKSGLSHEIEEAVLVSDVVGHPIVDPECSSRITYPLMDESGGLGVSYFGPFGAPTGASDPWGSITVVNSDDDLVIEVDMAFGWYVDVVEFYMGSSNDVTLSNGIPVVGTGWIQTDVNPLVNATQLSVPIESISDRCFELAVRLSVAKLDFFQGIDEGSRTTLWVSNKAWNDPGQPEMNSSSLALSPWCIIPCGPDVTVETLGNCQGCQSENTVEIVGCEKATVTSCKDLSNVVLLFTDNTFQKFDGLSAKTGTFSGIGVHDGKEIARVYVKSGCFQSGDGPGWGRRFDTPCNDDGSITVPGAGGGNGNGGNGNGGGKNK